MENNIFETLHKINVNEHVEEKNGLSYLSWAWAWAEVKKKYPNATYTIYENTLPNGFVVNYFTDGKTSYVKTGVTIGDIEYIENLPVMDYKNRSIALDVMTSFDVNKAIQRSLTKACARHGLGLYIYAGEDLPENEVAEPAKETKPKETKVEPKQDTKAKFDTALIEELRQYGHNANDVANFNGVTVKQITNDMLAKYVGFLRKQKEVV